MSEIWKFTLTALIDQTISIPADAEYLTAQAQDGQAVIWAIVNPDNPVEKRKIYVYGTGCPLDDSTDFAERWHLGTVPIDSFVWHIFDEGSD